MFYTFNQNNSGGSFAIDSRVAPYVIIEAHSVEDANWKAEDVGIYFDGVDLGYDCPCCGDRWYECWGGDGDDVPSIYSSPVENSHVLTTSEDDVDVYVYYIDGRKEAYRLK